MLEVDNFASIDNTHDRNGFRRQPETLSPNASEVCSSHLHCDSLLMCISFIAYEECAYDEALDIVRSRCCSDRGEPLGRFERAQFLQIFSERKDLKAKGKDLTVQICPHSVVSNVSNRPNRINNRLARDAHPDRLGWSDGLDKWFKWLLN